MKTIPTCLLILALCGSVLAGFSGCFVMRASSGGGQTSFRAPRPIRASDIALAPGYRIEPIATGLTFPTGVTFDAAGHAYVVESGYCYGEVWTTPRLLRIESGGRTKIVASGDRNGPWNGVTFAHGSFYVGEGGVLEGGRILQISPAGEKRVLLAGLPSLGDHHTNGPVIGPDGLDLFRPGHGDELRCRRGGQREIWLAETFPAIS